MIIGHHISIISTLQRSRRSQTICLFTLLSIQCSICQCTSNNHRIIHTLYRCIYRFVYRVNNSEKSEFITAWSGVEWKVEKSEVVVSIYQLTMTSFTPHLYLYCMNIQYTIANKTKLHLSHTMA